MHRLIFVLTWALLTFQNVGYAYDGHFTIAAENTAARNLAPRALTQADLGVKGTLEEMRGTFSVTDGIATARIDMIQGKIANPFEIIKNLSATARAGGASTLRITGRQKWCAWHLFLVPLNDGSSVVG